MHFSSRPLKFETLDVHLVDFWQIQKTKVNLIGQTKHTLQLMHKLFSSIRNYFSHLLLVIQNWHRNIEIEFAYLFPCSQYKIADFLHSCSSIEHSIIQWSHCTARRPGRRSLPLVLAFFRLKPQPPPKQGSDRPTRFSRVASLLAGGGLVKRLTNNRLVAGRAAAASLEASLRGWWLRKRGGSMWFWIEPMDMLQKWLAVMERRADGVPMREAANGVPAAPDWKDEGVRWKKR